MEKASRQGKRNKYFVVLFCEAVKKVKCDKEVIYQKKRKRTGVWTQT